MYLTDISTTKKKRICGLGRRTFLQPDTEHTVILIIQHKMTSWTTRSMITNAESSSRDGSPAIYCWFFLELWNAHLQSDAFFEFEWIDRNIHNSSSFADCMIAMFRDSLRQVNHIIFNKTYHRLSDWDKFCNWNLRAIFKVFSLIWNSLNGLKNGKFFRLHV